ncbi:hypothetical protein F0562_008665 [Nyssa sinensis]|uniref:NB-ARC domain-containing protein n=1 Tax=Nyssa sinensis TaxID=561372 RepID=A0A5J5ABJ8_9ASTE|nr:hypothetical protein F0562_008665 [Nyssa sinensis]
MADIAVTVTLFLVETVVSSLDLWNFGENLRDEVGHLRTWLSSMQASLRDMEWKEGNESQKDRIQQVRDVAYDIEDVLDRLMLHAPRRFHRHEFPNRVRESLHDAWHSILLYEMPSKIEKIMRKIHIIGLISVVVREAASASAAASSVERQVTPQILADDEILGFEEPREKLIRQLTQLQSRRLTISVVGPGGSGKTIFVRNVYESKKGMFDSHAWVRVSRSFNINELVCSMLKKFRESTREPTPHQPADTESELRNYLQRKRYVLVLDDIWRKDDCECIKNVLPNGSSGSKIIVTTRNADVASFCADSPDFVHSLNGLEWPNAWLLFCRKAFQNRNGECPPVLEDWSQKILKKCEGLPLAIVAVAGLLSKKQQLKNEWKKLHDSLGSEIRPHCNLSIISETLLPSYKDLSSNLRTCFLYFSIFPEDRSIKRGRLIRLWVAEGFVTTTRGKTLEEVAEDYLNELIERNLVHVSKWDFDGRVSCCRVPNLVREFVVFKSEDENFVSILPEPNTSSGEKVRRLSIHDGCTTLAQSGDFSCVRSAFLFSWDGFSPPDFNNMLHSFCLLRVLDLEDAPIDKFPEQIVELTLLRYLSLRHTKIDKVPNSIKKLSFLETLDLKQTNVTKLPERILLLRSLRHLLVYRSDVNNYDFDSVHGVRVSPGIGDLTNLQKLSLVKPDKHTKIIKELGALTQLTKLGLIDLKKEDGKDLCESVQNMKRLLTLDVSSISKEWSRLQRCPLEALEQLPNLVELQMVDAFTGDKLVFEAWSFKKLKILHIQQFDRLNMVVIQQGAMSELQKLTLCECKILKMLPLGIDSLTHLKELLAYDMPNEFISRLQKTSEDRVMIRTLPGQLTSNKDGSMELLIM